MSAIEDARAEADLAAQFRHMADAAKKDSEGFWPKAPLYALERKIAAGVWREAIENIDHVAQFELYAPRLEARAIKAWDGGYHFEAVEISIQAATWRRIAKIVKEHES